MKEKKEGVKTDFISGNLARSVPLFESLVFTTPHSSVAKVDFTYGSTPLVVTDGDPTPLVTVEPQESYRVSGDGVTPQPHFMVLLVFTRVPTTVVIKPPYSRDLSVQYLNVTYLCPSLR